ncbi:uncharacterized protein ARMOST_11847 [Armillaria ostoyae]|uniref:Protein kinase domain-containing protein n=1 Tax=Armillaria ostoyae TaxID=47428 RepID=A0A284RIB5_ARMOS|nr:uncharacterized protein ARMOST_11847 [Armillaria ostoyae]
MAAAIFFLDPLLSFYPSQFFPNITMSSSIADDGTALPPSPGRKTPPNGSRAQQILSAVQSTPLSNHAPTVDPATKADHHVGHFDRYIEEDLRERVFMHAEHFFPTILHLPPDWKNNDEITKQTKAIRDNPVFKQHMQTYVDLCDETNPGEKSFYHPYGVMCNSAFDVLVVTDNSGLGIYRQDAKPVIGSEEKNVPDTLGVLRAMFTSSGNIVDKMKDNGPEHNFSWAQTMHWQEFKPKFSFLDEGTDARYRVLSDDDKDPRGEVRGKTTVHRDPGSILPHVRSSRLGSTAKKRRSQKEPPHASKHARSGTTPDVSDARNRSENSTALSSLREGDIAVDEPTTEEEEQSQARRKPIVQCGRYALEILSSAGFRTHCLGALVTVRRIQLLYYDRSIIIVCKPIDMFKRGPDPLGKTITLSEITDEFGALLIGLGRFTLKQRGIQEQFCVDRALIENYKTYMKRCVKDGGAFDQRDVFKGVKLPLKLKSGKGDEEVEVTLGRIISRQPAIIGRHTCVVEAESAYEEWKGKKLVIKISWPAVERKSEADLVKIAREKARTMKTGKKPDWALEHLPDILLCQDFCYDADSTQASIAAFCKKAKCAENETMDYEHRVCRIMVQERLYPLEELRTVEEYAQVFFDILQSAYTGLTFKLRFLIVAVVHKWLYDHPRIIHRDISPGNIMWRRTVDGHVRGVLNDFDLSSLRDVPGASSFQRTGTLPYMAYELLINHKNGNPPKHLYRHDVESIFYVILLRCCRYEVVTTQKSSDHKISSCTTRIVPSQFDLWYTLGRHDLSEKKTLFFVRNHPTPPLNSGFTNFQPWIRELHKLFKKGFNPQETHDLYEEEEGDEGDEREPFDNETLGDRVSYSAILGTCAKFAGSSLVVRNDQLEVAV